MPLIFKSFDCIDLKDLLQSLLLCIACEELTFYDEILRYVK